MNFDKKVTLVTQQYEPCGSLQEHVNDVRDELINSKFCLEGEGVGIDSTCLVYKTTDPKTMRAVSLKRLKKEFESNDEYIKQFVREAQVTAQLEHPNIIPIYDFGKDIDDNFYYTMKYVESESLQEILEKISKADKLTSEAYPLQQLISIFLNVCNAVSYANAHGVYHKDLKPANFLVGDFGDVYVINWVIIENPNADKRTFYTAPEYRLGKENNRTEVYSLGGVLYNILTQNFPESPEEMRASFQEVLDNSLNLSGNLRVKFQPGRIQALISIMQKALAPSPNQRYENVETMSSEIQKWLEGFATDAEKTNIFTSLLLMIKRNRCLSLIIINSLVSLLLMCGLFYKSMQLEKKEADTWNEIALSEQNRINSIRAELTKSKEELSSKITELNSAAPVYFANAKSTLQKGDLLQALKYLEYSCYLDPQNEQYRLAKAHLLQLSFEFETALEVYKNCSLPLAQTNRQFIENHISINDSWFETAYKLKIHLNDEGRVLHGRYLQALIESKKSKLLKNWNLEVRGTDLEPYDKKLKIEQGQVKLDLSNSKIGFFPELKTPISELNLSGSNLIKLGSAGSLPLRKLDLSRTKIIDILPLIKLRITHLNLSRSSVQNLEDIALIEGLRSLDLSYIRHRDFSFLESLNLKELNLNYTDIKSVDSLRNMKLQDLSLIKSKVTDLTPLKGHPLRTFKIDSKGLSNIAALEGAPLENLELQNCQVTSLDSLHSAKLQTLKVINCPLGEIKVLGKMPLTNVHLEKTNVKDIECLRNKNINELAIPFNPILDISLLKGMPISSLRIPGTQIHDLSQVKNIPFSSIYITSSKVKSLDFLRGMPVLILHMRHTEINSLEPLETTNLEYLYASGCKNLTSLKGLENLVMRDLYIDNTSISDLKFLPSALENLNLAGTKVRDLKPLEDRPLRSLSITNCEVDDFKVLTTLKKLSSIRLPDHFKESHLLRQMPSLKHIHYQGKNYSTSEFLKKFP